MIGIEQIGVYIPPNRIDNRDRVKSFEIDETFIKSKTGMLTLAIKENDDDTSDLGVKALRDLCIKSGLDKSKIQCLIFCTQNPDGYGIPHTAALVHEKFGLSKDCAAFDVSLGCSGYVYCLSIIEGFMHRNGYKTGVLITSDPYSKIIDKNDKNTALLFGDASTATLLSSQPKWKCGKFLLGSDGSLKDSIRIDRDSKFLAMNGRSVFSFTATVIPRHIREMLALNEMEVSDVDLFVFHQGSKYILDTLTSRMKLTPEKLPFCAGSYGNTVSSSIPIILNEIDSAPKKVVISGFGVGLSWGSTVLTST